MCAYDQEHNQSTLIYSFKIIFVKVTQQEDYVPLISVPALEQTNKLT